MRRLRHSVLALALLAAPAAALAEGEPVVKTVEVEGTRRVEAAESAADDDDMRR